MRRVAARIMNCARVSDVHRRRKQPRRGSNDEGTAVSLNMTQHYDIADSTKERENILEWVHANSSDIAMKVWHTMYLNYKKEH